MCRIPLTLPSPPQSRGRGWEFGAAPKSSRGAKNQNVCKTETQRHRDFTEKNQNVGLILPFFWLSLCNLCVSVPLWLISCPCLLDNDAYSFHRPFLLPQGIRQCQRDRASLSLASFRRRGSIGSWRPALPRCGRTPCPPLPP